MFVPRWIDKKFDWFKLNCYFYMKLLLKIINRKLFKLFTFSIVFQHFFIKEKSGKNKKLKIKNKLKFEPYKRG